MRVIRAGLLERSTSSSERPHTAKPPSRVDRRGYRPGTWVTVLLVHHFSCQSNSRGELFCRPGALPTACPGPRASRNSGAVLPAVQVPAGPAGCSVQVRSLQVPTPAAEPRRRGKRRRRGPWFEDLPRERVEHPLADEDRRCLCCNREHRALRYKTSEQVKYRPSVFVVLEHAQDRGEVGLPYPAGSHRFHREPDREGHSRSSAVRW